MEEIYANVEYAQPVDSNPLTNQTAMEEIYVNTEYEKSQVSSRPSRTHTGPSSSEIRSHRAVVLSLGLLSVFLLAGLVVLGVHYFHSIGRSAAELSAVKANLTEERDRLNVSLIEALNKLTAELSAVKANLTEERDRLNVSLIEALNKLRSHEMPSGFTHERLCPAGWTNFSCACYLLSEESGSWGKGRQDCSYKGADLVVISSTEEQMFLSKFPVVETSAWIGLTDRVKENSWVWIDGAPLSLEFWRKTQPDNGGKSGKLGEEDCAHIIAGEPRNWNDLSCSASLRWICEKKF
ncbi:C-type lectin domain family 17, member A-like isoform X2 [Anoplopoma fimbria]|uniref:C-type lectin domain family 17, member A-like isoform X2 n=1 Tax=Anoplopoma fimbria TaxID=229290 RepID=UPI0023EB2947|nr:C-type lectin domain family 17, member A-like isoform X2 [Anoplopoma fimbria]